jgi:hypothetical protein
LHQYWQNKTLGLSSMSQKKRIPRSKAALNKPLSECRVEHTVPLKVIVNRIMDMESLTAEAVVDLLLRWYVVRLVTHEEDARLTRKGLRFSMPSGWDNSDIFARYAAVGIEADGHQIDLTPMPNQTLRA